MGESGMRHQPPELYRTTLGQQNLAKQLSTNVHSNKPVDVGINTRQIIVVN